RLSRRRIAMADAFIGEIRIFAGSFAPLGWAFCDGRLLPISENDALFTLIGTTYGGDGENTFALPDLRGRVPVHQGQGLGTSNSTTGGREGAETVTVRVPPLRAHSHTANAGSGGNDLSPAGNVWATDAGGNTAAYSDTSNALMAGGAIGVAGGSQPHDNI